MRKHQLPATYRWAMAALLLFICAETGMSQILGFPIYVDNPSAYARTNVPVTAPVPLPRGLHVYNPDGDFLLVDELGNPVAATSKVLARWQGLRDDVSKNVRWCSLTFNADVLPAGGQRIFYVVPGSTQAGQITKVENANDITINTGAAEFVLDKTNFSFFKSVKIGGQDILSAPGTLDVLDIALATIQPTLLSTDIEQDHTVRTVVCQRGSLASIGLTFTIRYYFTTGHSDVKVDFRLENSGNYGQIGTLTGIRDDTAHFDSLKLSLKLNNSSGDVVTTSTQHDLAGSNYVLNQDWSTPADQYQILDGFSFTENIGDATVATGDRYEGAIALNSTAGSISVATDRFWQNYPKSFEVDGDTISMGVYPSFGFGPVYRGQYGLPTSNVVDLMSTMHYRFEGGRWKTHTMNFDFRAPGATGFTPSEVFYHADTTNAPVLGRPGRSWPFRAWGFGDLIIERQNWSDVSQQRYERMMDILVDDSAADNQAALGQIGLPKFRTRGGTYGGRQMYGWENYGDIAWGDGYSSLHYDMPFGVLINWYRTGDYRFFDMGRDMCTHRRDYDQNHTTHHSSPRRGGQMYEKGFTHGNYNAPEASHTWVHGMLLYYVTTGDEGSYEAAKEVGEFYQRQQPQNWSGWWGSRILGWQLEGLANLYNYIGDPLYLTLAQGTMERWKTLDTQNTGFDGLVPNPGWSTPHGQTWMHAIVLNAMAKYYLQSFDQNAVEPIKKMGNMMRDSVVKDMPTGPMDSRTVGTVWRRLNNSGYEANPSVHHTWVTSQALAWSSVVFFDHTYILASRKLYQSATRYHQTAEHTSLTPRDYTDPNSFDPIAFRMMNFPNSETKIISNIALWGQAYSCANAFWTWTW